MLILATNTIELLKMNIKTTLSAILLCFLSLYSCVNSDAERDALNTKDSIASETPNTQQLLPEDFKVYTNGYTVINHESYGFVMRVLPTINHYKGNDGGYVALYSQQEKGSVYSVGGGIYVMGQIRVKGKYEGRIFYPKGYSTGDNITQDEDILKRCNEYFPQFKGLVWIGGDTGGWFGVQ